jgi:hypothetical protein
MSQVPHSANDAYKVRGMGLVSDSRISVLNLYVSFPMLLLGRKTCFPAALMNLGCSMEEKAAPRNNGISKHLLSCLAASLVLVAPPSQVPMYTNIPSSDARTLIRKENSESKAAYATIFRDALSLLTRLFLQTPLPSRACARLQWWRPSTRVPFL